MKYTARYLPIRRTVKEGDIAFFKPDGTLIIRNHGLPPTMAMNMAANGCKAAKLFLTSDTAMLGYKLMHSSNMFGRGLILTEDNFKIYNFLVQHEKETRIDCFYFLVIGKIVSGDAKHGDKYTWRDFTINKNKSIKIKQK